MKKFQPWRVSILAGLLTLFALLMGAITWVMTGSREQAFQTAAVILLIELAIICAIAFLAIALS